MADTGEPPFPHPTPQLPQTPVPKLQPPATVINRRLVVSISDLKPNGNTMKIIAYLKPSCGWSRGVRAVLAKYDLAYEDRDIINEPSQREEMVRKSGQQLSPCVEVDGTMLADISGEELEQYLLSKQLVQPRASSTDVPLDQGCPGHGSPVSGIRRG